jgi:hypothetical protein
VSHWLRSFFLGWSKESVWIFVVDVLILILIFVREYIWDAWVWLRNRQRSSVDIVVAEHLSRDYSGQGQTVNQISAATKITRRKVEASLYQLAAMERVKNDGTDQWWKVRY